MTPSIQNIEDVERAISVIKSSIMKRGALPENLVESITAELTVSKPEIASCFLDKLFQECPGAAKYFAKHLKDKF
ncbi:MAG: hypothetical protein PWP45_617 [Tepidanaerobacteraceae bacterium]|jgi:hypothetical protein|uniref:Uncharacterized protein n=1 Tax=Fervidicola ferrireducens TaxID=520764 RepID=A0A140L9W2_9FIRM|nr:hypothetical protein [Fervidicola ferrireducens]KXG77337.1 hypothetical protein AN618_12350 [Fervidicola ferrireducens]MDN5331392.1 hypothetical protein [Tepidanaerobacteraceae bacterium]